VKTPSLKDCEKAIGEPAKAWVARCYEIACKIVEAGLVPDGTAVYGHWLGSISPRSHFADRAGMGFVQHGWIWVEREGAVVDPTRFVFEARTPYIYVEHEPVAGYERCKHCQMLQCEHDALGANDECDLYEPERWPYDEGGNRWRAAMQIRPAPKPKAREKRFPFKLDADVAGFVSALLGQPDGAQVTKEQMFWLANLPYQKLAHKFGPRAVAAIYEAICAAGDAAGESYFIEFIPIDNRTKAKREAGFGRC
jgi:hypothetical protein